MKFPMWLYHKDLGAKLFESEEQMKSAGAGWADSPAKFEEKPEIKEEPKEEAKEEPKKFFKKK